MSDDVVLEDVAVYFGHHIERYVFSGNMGSGENQWEVLDRISGCKIRHRQHA